MIHAEFIHSPKHNQYAVIVYHSPHVVCTWPMQFSLHCTVLALVRKQPFGKSTMLVKLGWAYTFVCMNPSPKTARAFDRQKCPYQLPSLLTILHLQGACHFQSFWNTRLTGCICKSALVGTIQGHMICSAGSLARWLAGWLLTGSLAVCAPG